MRRVGHVQLQHISRLGQTLGAAFGQGLGPPKPGQDDLRAFVLSCFGHRECNRLRRQYPGDQKPFALEQHAPTSAEERRFTTSPGALRFSTPGAFGVFDLRTIWLFTTFYLWQVSKTPIFPGRTSISSRASTRAIWRTPPRLTRAGEKSSTSSRAWTRRFTHFGCAVIWWPSWIHSVGRGPAWTTSRTTRSSTSNTFLPRSWSNTSTRVGCSRKSRSDFGTCWLG